MTIPLWGRRALPPPALCGARGRGASPAKNRLGGPRRPDGPVGRADLGA